MSVDFTSLFAYIGPGADLGLISSVIGLLLTVGTSMFFIVLMPFRAMLRRLRGSKAAVGEMEDAEMDVDEADAIAGSISASTAAKDRPKRMAA